MKVNTDQQQRVLGRMLAQSVCSQFAAAAEAAGGTLPTADSGTGLSARTGGPTLSTIDIRVDEVAHT